MTEQDPRPPRPVSDGDLVDGTHVVKGTRLASSTTCSAGPGTIVVADDVVADRPGIVRYTADRVRVVPPPPTRRRRGQAAATDTDGTLTGGRETPGKATHRHGVGKHGRLRGKTKKGFGDQGTWD